MNTRRCERAVSEMRSQASAGAGDVVVDARRQADDLDAGLGV
jgi:hypothetical protein